MDTFFIINDEMKIWRKNKGRLILLHWNLSVFIYFVEILVNFKVNLKQSVLLFMYFLKFLSNFIEKSLKQRVKYSVE